MQELRERLLSQIEKMPGPLETECWIFQTTADRPIMRWGNQVGRASRFAYQAFVGPIKDDYYICHKCDVPACCRPDHLFQGSPKENVLDALAKGRIKVKLTGT